MVLQISEEDMQLLRNKEIAEKNYTLQNVLDENNIQCLVLLKYFDDPIWVSKEKIKLTKEYTIFKNRKKEISKLKSKKRKRSQ